MEKSIKSTKRMNWSRWTARLISSVIILIWGFFFFSQLFTNYYDETGSFAPSEGAIYASVPIIILLVGTIIAWLNEKWGGIILIAGYFPAAIGGYLQAVSNLPPEAPAAAGFIPVILYLPFLISGILFILFWSKNRIKKTKKGL